MALEAAWEWWNGSQRQNEGEGWGEQQFYRSLGAPWGHVANEKFPVIIGQMKGVSEQENIAFNFQFVALYTFLSNDRDQAPFVLIQWRKA